MMGLMTMVISEWPDLFKHMMGDLLFHLNYDEKYMYDVISILRRTLLWEDCIQTWRGLRRFPSRLPPKLQRRHTSESCFRFWGGDIAIREACPFKNGLELFQKFIR